MVRDPDLTEVLDKAPALAVSRRDRFVVFSDLHVGNGGSRDDFLLSSPLLMAALERYYLPARFTLILNGDIEELWRFHLAEIRRRWKELFDLFAAFAREGRLERIVGNHDAELALLQDAFPAPRLLEALRLEMQGDSLFLFHGHQPSRFLARFPGLSAWGLRHLATPLGIHSFSVSRSNRKKFRVEKRIYSFARAARILALIGHTHRPLFESLSKVDSLRFRIEQLCRQIPEQPKRARLRLEAELLRRKAELERLLAKPRHQKEDSLYATPLLVPCLFNSGCCVGKRGVTGIEIRDGHIALVHWFDRRHSVRYLDSEDYEPEPLDGGPFHRVVLQEELLAYLFTRIRLLS